MALFVSDAPEPANPDRLSDGLQKPDEAALYGDTYDDLGDLLTVSPEKAAEMLRKKWDAQDPVMQPRLVRWEVNRMRRQGVADVYAIVDGGRWKRWVSPRFRGPETTPRPNLVADTCRAFVAFLMADPPAPQVQPSSGDDDDEEAAMVCTRVLEDVQGESGLRAQLKTRMAVDMACDHGSAFEHFYIDPQAVRIPIRIKAGFHPGNPMLGIPAHRASYVGANGDPGDTLVSPITGLPWPMFERRYVMQDGRLTDDQNKAARKWGPKICSEVLTGRNVRMIPHTASSIWEASGVIISSFDTWGKLKGRWRDEEGNSILGGLPEELQTKIRGYRPKQELDILPTGYTRKDLELRDDSDEALVFWQMLYHEACPDYPQGAYVVSVGGCYAVVQEPWTAEVPDGEESRAIDLMLPVSQYRMFAEGQDDPYSVGLSQLIGGLGEAAAILWAMIWDNAEKIKNRKLFITPGSNVQPHHLANPGRRIIPVAQNAKPSYEDIPPLPPEVVNLLERVQDASNNASGLNDTANGLENDDVKSGRQAYAIIGQAHGRVSEVAQNVEAGYVRGCRIAMQLLSVHMSDEQVVSWKEDGEHRTKFWRGADLSTDRDIIVRPGTMTMMTPSAKEMLLRDYQQMGLLQPFQLLQMIRSNVGGRIGLEDDRHYQRVRAQCAAYLEGPPEEWTPAPPQVQQMPDGSVQQVPSPDPLVTALWTPLVSDELPEVAQMRLSELAKAEAHRKHLAYPPEWRAGLENEIRRMVQAASAAQQPGQPGQPQQQGGAQQQAPQQQPQQQPQAQPYVPVPGATAPMPPGMGFTPQPITAAIQQDAAMPDVPVLL